ncbi:hypothetical protein SAMD00023353_4000670 [Rosellinia necatrix]|uniref:Uncharacterized protein n=1 Tax=Rosellinia necatrix TaxID=77044 RepID=A0A1S8A966_ROSNE|nr:hypothetical protein SAMD00023353_4000670 [Rosellinia necatrix]
MATTWAERGFAVHQRRIFQDLWKGGGQSWVWFIIRSITCLAATHDADEVEEQKSLAVEGRSRREH